MIGAWAIHGHAIVTANERIAGADGRMPPELRNPEDWRRFQDALDRAAVVVLGRLSHELTPNPKGRTRVVMSRSGPPPERQRGVIWWNPDEVPLLDALAGVAEGGVAAVVGGRRVFDHFLALGYDEFDLARSARLVLADGIPLFSAIAEGRDAASLLSAGGLSPGPAEVLDAVGDVSLTVWRRRA